MHKLMIKQHTITGLKYLCYTRSSGDVFENYKGSGKYWRRHLKEHGDTITTDVIFETTDKEEFKTHATKISLEFDVVNSNDWANLKIEEGDGGNTTGGKIWITDGNVSKYIDRAEPIPFGWRRGRSNIAFNDPVRQAEFSKRADRKKTSESLKKTWKEGNFKRDNTYLTNRTGDNNPTKRPEVQEKIRQAAINDSMGRSERLKQRWADGKMPKTKGGDNHPSKRPEVKEKLRQAALKQHGKN